MKSHDQTTDMVRAFMMNVLVYRILEILDKEVGDLILTRVARLLRCVYQINDDPM